MLYCFYNFKIFLNFSKVLALSAMVAAAYAGWSSHGHGGASHSPHGGWGWKKYEGWVWYWFKVLQLECKYTID